MMKPLPLLRLSAKDCEIYPSKNRATLVNIGTKPKPVGSSFLHRSRLPTVHDFSVPLRTVGDRSLSMSQNPRRPWMQRDISRACLVKGGKRCWFELYSSNLRISGNLCGILGPWKVACHRANLKGDDRADPFGFTGSGFISVRSLWTMK